jgi:hypothetical protein
MRALGQSALFLGILALTSLVPLGSSPLCSPAALAGEYRSAGQDGHDGLKGRDGRDGRNGQDQTVFANGSAVTLDLSGQDGADGEDGENAQRPYCRGQRADGDRDIQLPDGGDGGAGGNGGNGGAGGTVTVYYTNPSDLKKIAVRSPGGVGGRSGRGGYGSEGCNCDRRHWEVKVCKGTPGSPDYSCQSRRYTCRDGRDGYDGRDGQAGHPGQLGMLSLVPQTQQLAPENPTLSVAIPELANREVALSKNRWQARQGATALLAPGSVIADEYREFVERLEGTFRLAWQAQRSLNDFAGQTATLQLNDDQQIQVVFPEDVWVQGDKSQQGNQTTYTVTHALQAKEATQLKVADFSGKSTTLALAVVDLAGKSDLLTTQFRLKYRAAASRDRFGSSDFKTRYEGTIPADLVSRDYNRFTLALGKLPINGEYLSAGTDVELELVATRSLGNHSAEQTIRWQGEI